METICMTEYKNTEGELQELEEHIGRLSSARLRDKQLLVIGYSGNDDSVITWFEK